VPSKIPLTRGRGRPRKFGRASRAVTVTLPEDVLARLGAIDADLGRAIVTAVDRAAAPRPKLPPPAELATYGNHAVILVTPIAALRQLPGVELIPIGGNRALIALEGVHQIPRLELDVRDAMERNGGEPAQRAALSMLADILRDARSSPQLKVAERTIIVLEYGRRRGKTSA
jgi:hypothetical protein